MAELTEKEILECLNDNLKIAVETCQKLADGERGPIYPQFHSAVKLVDGACRQMSGFREDTRWSAFALYLHEVPDRVRKWLVDDKKTYTAELNMLADIFRWAQMRAKELETKRTGKRGIILPTPRAAETRTQGRSILVPSTYRERTGE